MLRVSQPARLRLDPLDGGIGRLDAHGIDAAAHSIDDFVELVPDHLGEPESLHVIKEKRQPLLSLAVLRSYVFTGVWGQDFNLGLHTVKYTLLFPEGKLKVLPLAIY